MNFREEETAGFLEVFEASKEQIRHFPGCHYLRLLRGEGNIFFTHSHWESPEALEAYRNSELFRTTWAKTKPRFAAPAEAWSLDLVAELK